MGNEEELREELERLRRENEQLRQQKSRELHLKVSQKGAVSVYGLGRFPVTLYKEQWIRLLDIADGIRAFLVQHDSELARRR